MQSQDGRGIGQGEHFIHQKFVRRSFECGATSTKQLLNAGRGHRTTRKTSQSLQKEVGQNIKDKNKDKEFRDQRRSILGRELWRRTSFHIIGNPLTGGLVGRFGISKGNIARKKKKKKLNQHYQWRNCSETHVCQQQVGAGQGSIGYIVCP